MATSRPNFDLAIVGGGIGGICLALSILHHSSIPITIYEDAPKFGEIGAGLAFGPNAVRAMSLISDEVRAGLEAVATKNISPDKQDMWFNFHIGMDGTTEEARQRGVRAGAHLLCVKQPPPYSSTTHRAHFIDQLVKHLPDAVTRFSKRLVDIRDDGEKEGVLLTFKDGTQYRHSAVIGADGIKSTIRPILLGRDSSESQAIFTGKYCYRGLVPMNKAVERIGPELARNCQAYLGYHGHILTFPVAGGQLMNVVAFASRPDWPYDQTVIPATREQMLKTFEDWGPSVRGIIELVERSDIWALFDHPPAKTYTKGRVCIIGDAAHASTPFQGAGAGMAVEDAYVLGRILKEVTQAHQIPAAFRAYDMVRRDRTQKLVATSREAGTLWHFELEGDDLAAITESLKVRMNWIWEHDFAQDIEKALSVLKDEKP